MTTLKDLSRHLNLSITQVSRALNDHGDVSESTKHRVREAAKSLNYKVNASAKRLVTGRSGIVGLVVEQNGDVLEPHLFTQMIWGLSRAFSDLERQFILHATDGGGNVTHDYESLIDGAGVDGFIITDPLVDDPRVAYLRKRKVPFVVHGRLSGPEDYAYYDIDNFAVAHELTQLLVDHGHRRIAFLNGLARRTYVEARGKGFRAALKTAGIEFNPKLHVNQESSEANGLVSCIRLFSKGFEFPTAIICDSVSVAKGVYAGLSAMGLKVPEDVSVVAHDDMIPGTTASGFVPNLTTTEAALSNSWYPMASLLDSLIEGSPLSEVQVIEPLTLCERDSVGRL